MALLSSRTSPQLISLHFTKIQNKITSHKSHQFNPLMFKIINRKTNKPAVTTSDNWMRSAHFSVFVQNIWVLINGHYFIWQLCPLFTQNLLRDDRQCSARRCSALPWLDAHTFKFNVLKLILGFYSPCFKNSLEYFPSAHIQAPFLTDIFHRTSKCRCVL